MIINGQALLAKAPIKDMLTTKERLHGVSFGLAEAGYDIRLKQDIVFDGGTNAIGINYRQVIVDNKTFSGRFCIASAIEEFDMPNDLVGVVHDKSTWARRGLAVFNTVIEPGWKGFLTLELVYHGSEILHLPAGAGIAQVLFSQIAVEGNYTGKYQHQADRPVPAIMEKG